MKIKNRKFLLMFTLIYSTIWLNNCQGLSRPNLTPIITTTSTHTNSPTQIPPITSTPIITPTITETSTLTPTITETPAFILKGDIPTLEKMLTHTPHPYNEPGTYWIYKCSSFIPMRNFPEIKSVTLCLNTVVINKEYEMRFNMNWTVFAKTHVWLTKPSDANNYDIFLQDNLENYYHHIYTGGCAGQDTFIDASSGTGGCNGWFQFSPAKPGATSFRFVDSANLVTIENIILLP